MREKNRVQALDTIGKLAKILSMIQSARSWIFIAGVAGMAAAGGWTYWHSRSGKTAFREKPTLDSRASSQDAVTELPQHKPPPADIPLAPGAPLPTLDAEGWINGPAPEVDQLTGRIMVVDVFDDLCPVCGAAAPELIDLQRKYEAEGVTFVGLTYAQREPTEKFVRETQIKWPVGFGAGKTISALVGPAPTVFVVGADRRVVWHDNRSRFRHDIASFRDDLETAIRKALAQTAR